MSPVRHARFLRKGSLLAIASLMACSGGDTAPGSAFDAAHPAQTQPDGSLAADARTPDTSQPDAHLRADAQAPSDASSLRDAGLQGPHCKRGVAYGHHSQADL